MVDEQKQHEMALKLIGAASMIAQRLHDEGLIPLGGMVPREQYKLARK